MADDDLERKAERVLDGLDYDARVALEVLRRAMTMVERIVRNHDFLPAELHLLVVEARHREIENVAYAAARRGEELPPNLSAGVQGWEGALSAVRRGVEAGERDRKGKGIDHG